jgi:signal transduction histidine kinase
LGLCGGLIEYVNRTHKPINGFEEGRIFNGFRHVYPLFDDENNYLGSVEVSSSALSYKKVFEVSEKKEMDIVLREDVVKTKLFSSEQGNYVPYSMNPSFLIERAMVEDDLKNRIDRDHTKGLEKLSRRTDIREKMASMERFTIFDYHNGQFDLISFLPLTNTVSKAKVGYAIVFRESSYIQKALHEYLFEVSRALVESLFLTIVLYFIRSHAKVLKEREHTLKKAEDVNRAKDSFLANMSHELRTPLNAIIGFSQILMAKKDTPQNVKDIVEKIQLSGKNLLSLVNTILDFSKIEAGEMELHPSDFSLYELGKELGVLVEPMLYKKELSLILEINEEMSITADRQLLKQVLLNLLSNAIKFSSHKESITLSCTLESDKYLMSCCDRGHGIAEDKIATLFDPFTQIREHQKEAIKGTGLGLAIVKRIVELHDGKVWVESEVEKGSCFYITLPR